MRLCKRELYSVRGRREFQLLASRLPVSWQDLVSPELVRPARGTRAEIVVVCM